LHENKVALILRNHMGQGTIMAANIRKKIRDAAISLCAVAATITTFPAEAQGRSRFRIIIGGPVYVPPSSFYRPRYRRPPRVIHVLPQRFEPYYESPSRSYRYQPPRYQPYDDGRDSQKRLRERRQERAERDRRTEDRAHEKEQRIADRKAARQREQEERTAARRTEREQRDAVRPDQAQPNSRVVGPAPF
jgi:hypothetical protein